MAFPTNKTNGNDTIGAATIVDRVEGWGHTAASDTNRKDNATWGNAAGNTITATDSSKEVTDDRADRLLITRKSGNPTDTPDTDDRSRGLGKTIDTTKGADLGYVAAPKWEAGAVALGVDYDVEYTGSQVEYDETSDSEFLASGRTSVALPTSDLVAPATPHNLYAHADFDTVGSIVDRSAGWGHNKGSQTDRKHGSGDAASDTAWTNEALVS